MTGMVEDDGHGVRYMPIEDVSDSSEAEMDMSEDEGQEDDGQPKKKQARTDKKAADGDSVPKWSNPDPYTVLPPPDETQRKKKDVVKLIRKARVEAAPASTAKTGGDADDFISFNFGDETEEEDDAEEEILPSKPSGVGVVGAPTGPRQTTQRGKPPMDTRAVLPHDFANLAANPQISQMGGRGPALPLHRPNLIDLTSEPDTGDRKRDLNGGVQKPAPSRPANAIDLTVEPALGSRKRTIRDEIKDAPTLRDAVRRGPAVNSAPEIHKTVKGKPPRVGGEILKNWSPKDGISPTPWIIIDHSDTAKMGVW
jgi:non-canonical poly(A) RNA polymerase PAPD5/7